MLVAAVVPSTKVVSDLFPLTLRVIPRGSKRPAPAPLRCASPSVSPGLAEFQIRVVVLNGFTALGIPVTEAVG
jgi:hypothetical protein